MTAAGPRHVYRPSFWRGVAFLWAPLAAFLLWDTLRREWSRDSMTALAIIGTITALVYAVGWRPVVIGDAERILVRNPFRTANVPWNAVEEIDLTDSLRVHTHLVVVRAWAIERGGAAVNMLRGVTTRRLQAPPGVPRHTLAEMARRSPADAALANLVELWRQRSGQTRGVAKITWAWPTIALIVALFGLSVVLLATG